MRCPCQRCSDRTSECHASCQRYGEWHKWNEGRKEWLRSQKPRTSEGLKKQETEKLRRKAKYGNGGKWKGANVDG